MSTKPPNSRIKNSVTNFAKCFSIKARIGAPKYHNSPATMKKRIPRDSAEATVNVVKSSPVTPLAMVMTL